jgi:hypothetical protein
MPRVLDGVKVGDWLTILVNGVPILERVTRMSLFVVETKNYRFTRYGRIWPTHKPSVLVEPSSKDEIERWLAQPSEGQAGKRTSRRR